jgi:hypothetical protein
MLDCINNLRLKVKLEYKGITIYVQLVKRIILIHLYAPRRFKRPQRMVPFNVGIEILFQP